MSKRTVFTTLTPLPAGISRETVRETLHDHLEMIDLNPLVEDRRPIKPPSNATSEEYHCVWYEITDKVQYLPGEIMSGKVSYNACFHDLENGVQTHIYAPMGLNIRGKWTLGGTLPGEPVGPQELGIGAPMVGLWLREDVDMKCNILMTSFVKKTVKKSHSKLVDRLVAKAAIADAARRNEELAEQQQRAAMSHSKATHEGSDHDNESVHSNNGPNSPGFNLPHLAQTPQLSDHPAFRDHSNDDGLTPRPLSLRSSSASYSGSLVSSATSRSSAPENALGINAGNRVSWNTLNAARTPSQSYQHGNAGQCSQGNQNQYQQGTQYQYQQGNQNQYQQGNQNQYQHASVYPTSPPAFGASELPSEPRDQARKEVQPTLQQPQQAQQPGYIPYHGPSNGAVELE